MAQVLGVLLPNGTTIAWTTAGTGLETFVKSIEFSGLSREIFDVSVLATTGVKQYLPSVLIEGAKMTMVMYFDQDHALAAASVLTQLQATTADTFTITLPNTGVSGGTITGSAHLESYEWSLENDTPAECTAVFQMTTLPTFTAST